MAKRGPRGDLSRDIIVDAAVRLLEEHGSIETISLRMLATEMGVAANSIYTYFPSMTSVWHEFGERVMGQLKPAELLELPCRHCALLELFRRALELVQSAEAMAVLSHQPILGPNSFRLSETLMELCESGTVDPRDAHDLILGWFYGSIQLTAEGWTEGTDNIRAEMNLMDAYPRVANRSEPDLSAQVAAMIRGIGIEHRES